MKAASTPAENELSTLPANTASNDNNNKEGQSKSSPAPSNGSTSLKQVINQQDIIMAEKSGKRGKGSDSPPLQDIKHAAKTLDAGLASHSSRLQDGAKIGPVYEQFFKRFSFDETLSVTFYGRCLSMSRVVCFYIASVLTAGFVYLLSRWSTRFNAWATTFACPIAVATHILVVNSFEQHELVEVSVLHRQHSVLPLFEDLREHLEDQPPLNDDEDVTSQKSIYYPASPLAIKEYELRSIDYKCNRFVLNPLTGKFVSTNDFRLIPLPDLRSALSGERSPGLLERQRLVFGPNIINVSTKTAVQLFFDEVLHPFNVFQVGCIAFWTLVQVYYTYAAVLAILTILSCVTTLVETMHNLRKMQQMARFVCPVTAWRNGRWQEDVSSEELIPGDLIRLDTSSTKETPEGQMLSRLDILPCDGVILNGDALLDESMLTGETIPVAKTALDDAHPDDFERVCWGDLPSGAQSIPTTGAPAKTNPPATKSILFSGTRLIRARARDGRPPIAMVHRTGFLTAKGNLVQSILFPRPNNFRFYRDLVVFISILATIAFFGFMVSVYNMILLKCIPYYIISRGIDLFTIVVPPAIHTVMSIGTIFAMRRLKDDHSIYCISPPRINVASRIDLVCFDKTGTLTEEGLDVKTVLPANRPSKDAGEASFGLQSETTDELANDKGSFPSLVHLMATCHSIQVVNDELIGDPLDLKMFDFTRWKLEEAVETSEGLAPTVVRPPPSLAASPTSLSGDLGIIRCFEFSSQLRRMSVIVQPLDRPDDMSVLCKGSPESMRDICVSSSLPANYNRVLADYAQQGYRVLACAGRRLNKTDTEAGETLTWSHVQKLARKQVECDLTFLGFIVFENKLKVETAPVISTLRAANIVNVMSTGDNVLTAVCVARASGLVESSVKYVFVPRLLDPASHLPTSIAWDCIDDERVRLDPVVWEVDGLTAQRDYAMACTGEVMEHIFMACGDTYAQALLQRCNVFARMSPAQKQILVEYYQRFGHTVGFCGDGANDCGALRASNVGISLSQAEASVAAPFTSKIADIRCVPALIREGRASLATSFCLFKFMALYSMTQSTSLVFLYSYASSLGDGQFTYIDLALVLPLGLLQTRFETSSKLTKHPPTAKLFSLPALLSILGQTVIQGCAQTTAYLLTINLDGHSPPVVNPESANITCLENTSVFLASTFFYITTAIIFSQGRPYRRSWYWPFFAWCVIAACCNLLLYFYGMSPWPLWYFEFTAIPDHHRYRLLMIGGVHAVVAAFAEFALFPAIIGVYNSVMGNRRIKTVVPIEHRAV